MYGKLYCRYKSSCGCADRLMYSCTDVIVLFFPLAVAIVLTFFLCHMYRLAFKVYEMAFPQNQVIK